MSAGREGYDCAAARQALCRLAAGTTWGEASAGLARHAHRCPGCRDFTDRLARIRQWLDGHAAETCHEDEPVERLQETARRALVRELSARLARDLADLGEGRPARHLEQRRGDVQRLVVLEGGRVLRSEPWASALPMLLEENGSSHGCSRARALTLAACLDPHGVDLALAHLGQLVRHGHGDTADEEADRMLSLLGQAGTRCE